MRRNEKAATVVGMVTRVAQAKTIVRPLTAATAAPETAAVCQVREKAKLSKGSHRRPASRIDCDAAKSERPARSLEPGAPAARRGHRQKKAGDPAA